MTAKLIYKGELRTEATHMLSGTMIETDAPPDNNGKGERFSPTDLVAAAMASCMCTLMGIAANKHEFQLGKIDCEIEKIMAAHPRRIAEVKVKMTFATDDVYNDKQKKILEKAALTCPVIESLHPDLKKTVDFIWS